jgi:ABC-type glycerol-3-phosphate transport system substrate-binding protein
MTRRRGIAAVSTLLLSLCVLSCGGKPSDENVITFWQFWDLAAIEPIVEEFERQNPGIQVEVEQLTWKSGLEKIQP